MGIPRSLPTCPAIGYVFEFGHSGYAQASLYNDRSEVYKVIYFEDWWLRGGQPALRDGTCGAEGSGRRMCKAITLQPTPAMHASLRLAPAGNGGEVRPVCECER